MRTINNVKTCKVFNKGVVWKEFRCCVDETNQNLSVYDYVMLLKEEMIDYVRTLC